MSPGTRSLAYDSKATRPPSSERPTQPADASLSAFPARPPVPTLTITVLPVCRSRRNTSRAPFVSPATRSSASLAKASQRPSGVIAASKLSPSPGSPAGVTLSSVVVPVAVSRT